jgi:hypothetical protein
MSGQILIILVTFIPENEENENGNIPRELMLLSGRERRGHLINALMDLKDSPFPLISFCRYSKLCQKKLGGFSQITKQCLPSPWTPGFVLARLRLGDRQIIG